MEPVSFHCIKVVILDQSYANTMLIKKRFSPLSIVFCISFQIISFFYMKRNMKTIKPHDTSNFRIKRIRIKKKKNS